MHEIERDPNNPPKAYLVGIKEPEMVDSPGALLDELAELTGNLGIVVAGREVVNVRQPTPHFYIGSGKAEEIKSRAAALACELVIFDAQLAPAQQRNLEELFEIPVIDRHRVILDIFAERAQTREAVLQVELARSEYMLPRVKGYWMHLNRQRGGGVNQKGEGETQGEIDARAIRQKITRLKTELAEVTRHREVQRRKRERIPLPSAAIVGYTNAGKSSLLNALTGANVLSENKLFATLDPTTRQMAIPGGGKLLLTDTVGFVRRLPHRLVEAFKATLEEAVVSDFLIHIVDSSSPDAERHMQTTMEVLKELGADTKPVILVYNKADLSGPEEHIALQGGIFTSTVTGQGLEELKARIFRMAEERQNTCELLIPHDRYDVISALHEAGCIKSREITDDGVRLTCNLPERLKPYEKQFGATPNP